jgi:cyclase
LKILQNYRALKTRVIPCLQLLGDSLVKTVKFKNPKYIGDPINAVRIFNELEVDELCLLDIRATVEKRAPNFNLLRQIADECFMPLSFGGGIADFDTAKQLFRIGVEKIVLNTATYKNPDLIRKLSEYFGNQALIGSIDTKKNLFGSYSVYIDSGKQKIVVTPVEWAQKLESYGIGELLVTSIDREGTWEGFDIEIIKKITAAVSIPVIAHGGSGSLDHIDEVIKKGNVSAVALGSMVVYQKKNMGVLVNFPEKARLENILC